MTDIYRTAEGGQAVEQTYRKWLDRWPVAAERLTVPTREGDTFVLAYGPVNAPPVLALHGSGSNATGWLTQAAEWAQHLRVYAIDIIGEPGLSAPSRPPLASDAYVLWLDDVMKGLGLAEASVVGESLGGWLAVSYASSRPEKVTRLALLTPSGIGRVTKSVYLKVALLGLFGSWGKRKGLALMLGPGIMNLPKPRMELSGLTMLIAKHFKYRKETIPVLDDNALRRLTMPVLTIAGALDTMIDHHETQRRLEKTVPQVDMRLLPRYGHILPNQTEPVHDFLSSSEKETNNA